MTFLSVLSFCSIFLKIVQCLIFSAHERLELCTLLIVISQWKLLIRRVYYEHLLTAHLFPCFVTVCNITSFSLLCNSVTRNYFENLVRALENGLSDVDTQAVICNKMNLKTGAGPSKSKGGRGKGSSKPSTSVRNAGDSGNWVCDKCTYMNARSEAACQVCSYRR